MTTRDALQAVKATVSIVELLKFHGVAVPENTETQISCPFHGADNHPSARVYTSTNTIFCWTCHKLWDTIAAEMAFTELPLSEAVNALVARYSVAVEAQPQVVQRFYATANVYSHGDQKSASAVVADLGDKFRLYYSALPDWRIVGHLVDYFWREFDEFVVEEPADLIVRATDWFARAHLMISTQIPVVGASMAGEIVSEESYGSEE